MGMIFWGKEKGVDICMFRNMIHKWKNLSINYKKLVLGLGISVIASVVILVAVGVSANGKTIHEDGGTENGQEVISTETVDIQTSENIQTNESTQEDETDEVLPPEESNMIIDTEDPQQQSDGNMTGQSGASVDFTDVIEEINKENDGNEVKEITYGIDVAKYQGTIDWKLVAESGVDFAMVRVGYRTLKTGEIVADSNAKYNMQEASKYGIKVGVYFFSTAITKEEAVEEADWVANYISGYKITYPVAYNCEGFEDSENRQYGLTKSQRTDIAIAFLERIVENGYSPMFYASKNDMENDAKWEISEMDEDYRIWVAQYPSIPYPQTAESTYTGRHDMWQYTNKGTVPGIKKAVDVNVAYFGFRKEEGPKNEGVTEDVEADVEALMNFESVNEVVTAKERTNLRDKPSQGSESSVMYTLTNGETATRTGISDSGWSRVVFNGKTYYAVSSLLTTDLTGKTPVPEEPDDSENVENSEIPGEETETGTVIKTQFTQVKDKVTAKEVVNLRTLPSTTNENSEVVAQLSNGEVITRTGINTDLGWSRVEYNGQVLYCVSSFLLIVEEEAE